MARRTPDRWEAHPVLAWWVRVAVLLVPVGVSIVVALLVISALPEPDSGGSRVLWWVLVLGAAFLAAQLVERLARRALPLAVLLKLALVFPDQAPSRLRAARRTSLREIERQVAELREGSERGEPAEAARQLVSLVGALGMHDKRTRGHSERVRAYVDLLTEEMGLPEDARVRLRWAALLHDIGKLSVPSPVLNGGRELEPQDWEAIRRHPIEGERLAGALLPWLGEWGTCVREHHERWDGSGYPAGLAGTEISLGARIVAVADAFEVMTANRTYQPSISAAAAREELARCAGKDFDPAVVRAFLALGIGRLRGVLGPLAWLPALPVAAAADRVGDAAKGITTVAAVSAVTLAASGAVVTPALPEEPPPPVVALPTRTTVETPPTPRPTPAPSPSALPVRPRPLPRTAARVAPPRPAPRRPAPRAQLPPVLYVSGHRLGGSLPGAGSLSLAGSGTPVRLGVAVDAPRTVSGVPQVMLFQQLRTRHGQGLPRAEVSLTLLDCGPAGCRTLAHATAVLVRRHGGWQQQRVSLGRVSTTVASGHVVRLALSVKARRNVNSVLVGYGGPTPSRLLLP
ncbi:MAG TPA: HD domain-containing phosphohydrolase [Mycobacteriales bacterium]|nr:HD domain-containing phosphohydrolase [Mycobacteriales bacterium]